MRIGQKLLLMFLICILVLTSVGLAMTMHFKYFEVNMVRQLGNQTIFANYQNTLYGLERMINTRYSLPDRDALVQSVGQLRTLSEELLKAYPTQNIENLYYSTLSLCSMQDELEGLLTVDGFNENAATLLRTIDLIHLQYSYVSGDIHQYTLQLRDAIHLAGNRNLAFFLSTQFVVMVICIVLTGLWSARLVRPLKELVKAANDISWNQFDPTRLPAAENNDEIGYLICAFSDMAERIKTQWDLIETKARLEQQVKEEQIRTLNTQKMLKESELMILQAEINPHFLFNSMNLLRQMAYLEHAQETGRIVEVLSDILRYSMNCMHRETTLNDELENTRNYFFIQQKRFGNQVEYRIDVQDERLGEVVLPAMVLQPLVENSYKHSRDHEKGGNRIGVSVYSREDRVYIEVYDNGKGFTPQRLEEVRVMLEKPAEYAHTSNIGLKNVAARLALFFGSEARIEITSDSGWTTVSVIIPMRLKGKEHSPCLQQ